MVFVATAAQLGMGLAAVVEACFESPDTAPSAKGEDQ